MLIIDSIGTVSDATRTFDFRNNLFYTDPQYLAIMVAPEGTTRYMLGLLNPVAKAFLKNSQMIISDTIKNQSIVFSNPAPLILGYVQYQWQNNWPSSFTPTANQRLEAMEDPLNFGDVVPPTVPYNFGYSTASPLYTAGLNGEIMGDKKWFGNINGIESLRWTKAGNVKAYFNKGTLNLIFNASDIGSFTLRVYSLDGKQLANRLIHNYGQTKVQVDMNGLSRGIYIYVVECSANNGFKSKASGKVVLI